MKTNHILFFLMLFSIMLFFLPKTFAVDLVLYSPSLMIYNITTEKPHQNITLSLDYLNNFSNKKKTYVQIDNSITEVRNNNFLLIYQNPQYSQQGYLLIPSKITNWLLYNFTLYLSEKKTFNLTITNVELQAKKKTYVQLLYNENGSRYPGWFCLDNGNLRQLPLKDTLYYDLSIIVKSNGWYYYAYDILEQGKIIATCKIPPQSLFALDLFVVKNTNNNKIITKHSIEAGTYTFLFTPGYHKVFLFAYNDDGSLHNVSKDFYVIINQCGDLRCDIDEDCWYDCVFLQGKNASLPEQQKASLTIPEELAQKDPFILTIESTDQISQEDTKTYIVFDLSKEQYTASFFLSATEDTPFYVEDYYFPKKYINKSNIFSYTLDNQVIGNDIVQLRRDHNYRLIATIQHPEQYALGENYGIFDFGGKTQLYYKVIMPRSLYSQLHLPEIPEPPTLLEKIGFAIKEHLLLLVLSLVVFVLFGVLFHWKRKQYKKTLQKIKEKYGVEIEDEF